MSILKTRNRLINFRLTDEEFQSLHRACAAQGARSISDFARAAVMAQVETPSGGVDMARLHGAIVDLHGRIGELMTALPSPVGSTQPSH